MGMADVGAGIVAAGPVPCRFILRAGGCVIVRFVNLMRRRRIMRRLREGGGGGMDDCDTEQPGVTTM